MEVYLGYFMIIGMAIIISMPLTALAIKARRNKEAGKRLRSVMARAITEAQNNKEIT